MYSHQSRTTVKHIHKLSYIFSDRRNWFDTLGLNRSPDVCVLSVLIRNTFIETGLVVNSEKITTHKKLTISYNERCLCHSIMWSKWSIKSIRYFMMVLKGIRNALESTHKGLRRYEIIFTLVVKNLHEYI